jgi:cell wall-associated NlpC family hydrolase
MKIIAAGLALLIVLAFGAYKQEQSPVVITCGAVHGGTTAVARGAEWAGKFGGWVHNVADNPDQYRDPANVKTTVDGVLKDVVWYWLRSAYLGIRGEKADPEILRLQDDSAKQAQQARDMCTPCPTAVQTPVPQDSLGTPADQLSAAVPASSAFQPTGSPEEIVRQAAARYFPADQVDTAVAVAHAESGFNVKARNDVQAGMLGLWQINLAAHRDLVAGKDWTNPGVNAWLAYQIWHDAGDSWSPWSTYTSGSYRKYLSDGAEAVTRPTSVSPSTPAPGVGCQSGSMPAVSVATWNTFCGPRVGQNCGGDTPAIGRVVPGVKKIAAQADVFGLQEMSNSERRAAVADALPDFGIVGGENSDPIYYRKSMFTLTSSDTPLVFKRTDNYEGPGQGDRHVNTAVLRSTAGQTLTFINLHELPQIQKGGGLNTRWPKRVAAAKNLWQTAMTTAKTNMAMGAVIVVGDMNYTKDPDGLYASAGLNSVADVLGAPGQKNRDRDIDKILYSAGAPTSFRSLGQYGSDHQARIATFAASGGSASTTVTTAGARTVTSGGQTYNVPIPAGPRGIAINYALDQLGKPYVWGAHGPNAFDCSGLISAAYAKAGIDFTPQTEAMYREIPHTTTPQPGDIAYHPGHVQIVLNDGLILEAANPRVPIRLISKNWMNPTAFFDPTKLAGAAA